MKMSDFDHDMNADLNRNSESEYRRALDDASAIEAKSRLNRSRAMGFAVGAVAGLVITSIVLKAMGR